MSSSLALHLIYRSKSSHLYPELADSVNLGSQIALGPHLCFLGFGTVIPAIPIRQLCGFSRSEIWGFRLEWHTFLSNDPASHAHLELYGIDG